MNAQIANTIQKVLKPKGVAVVQGSAFGLGPDSLWFPPFIELLVAASIVSLAADTVIGTRLHRRWLSAAGLGLAFGFAFAFAVKPELQFAGSHVLASVLAFNVGVDLAQLVVLLLIVALLRLVFSHVVQERLEREYQLNLITTAPSVIYRVGKTNGETLWVDNPAKLPDQIDEQTGPRGFTF